MNRTTTMIVAVVVVIIVVAAAAAIVLSNNDGENRSSVNASQLQIMGNANDDYTIDDSDMEILDSILAGNANITEYPLADANDDGVVDEKDKALLQDIIDRKQGITIHVICLGTDGKETTVPCTYPLRNVVTYATNMQLPVLYANGGQYIAGYFTSTYEVAEASINDKATDLGGSSRSISDAAWANFTQLAAGVSTGIGAFMTDYSAADQITDLRKADLDAAGIPLIIYASADAESEMTTVLTLGFLFGGESEKMGVEYAQAGWDVLNKLKESVGGLSDEEKVSYICCTMWIYICENDSTYNTTAASAGGIPYYKINSDFASRYSGDSSTKMSSVEALSNYKDVGSIISNRSMDWGLTADKMDAMYIDCWENERDGHPTYEYFVGLENKLVFINNLLPGAVKLAYMAHALYGDQFSLEWANSVLQDYIDMGTAPLQNQTLDTIPAYVDYDAYQSAKA